MHTISKSILILFLFALTQKIQAQWNNIYQFDVEMHDLWFINGDTGFICGGATENPILMRTYNGGYTWNNITGNITDPVYAVNFLDESKGFIATWGNSSRSLWGTVDAGNTWQAKHTTTPYINTITFPSSQVGYTFVAVMEYVTVVKTTNGGDTWSQVAFLTVEAPGLGVPDAHFLNESTGYFVTDGGLVYKTTDGGENWTSLHQSFIYSLSGVYFTDQNTGYVTANTTEYGYPNGLLLKTTDGGLNWENTYFDTPCYDVWFTDPDTGYISTVGILKTTDGGNTWYRDTYNYTTTLEKLRFPDTRIGYALSSYPGFAVLMKRDPDIGVTVREIPDNFRFHVFPVPAEDHINLCLSIKTRTRVMADLLDGSGERVKQVYDAFLSEGDHSIRADISSLMPGIYYLRLQTMKDIAVKKIIIL